MAGLSGSSSPVSPPLQIIASSPLTLYYSLGDPPGLAIAVLLILSLLVTLDLYACVFYSNVPPSQPLFRPPPVHASSCSISKQAHFLLTLSSAAVICCACRVEYRTTLWPLSTKARPPEARRATYLLKMWIISLTRHSASHPLSGVQTACGIFNAGSPWRFPSFSEMEGARSVINMQPVTCPCLGDLLDNVQHRFFNWTVKKV